jgi:hypothetical protein
MGLLEAILGRATLLWGMEVLYVKHRYLYLLVSSSLSSTTGEFVHLALHLRFSQREVRFEVKDILNEFFDKTFIESR